MKKLLSLVALLASPLLLLGAQQPMLYSSPVVIASDQSAVPVTMAAPPTGGATAAKQDTGNASLASIDGKLGTLGQKAMTGSAPVVIASDQAAIPVTSTPTSTAPTTAATFAEGTKAPAAIATPEALATTNLVHSVIIRAGRTARVSNTGSVWIGTTSTNDSQLIELIPGAVLTISAPPGKYIDLATIYVDSVTLTDGVIYVAVK
jgi:hypothetical protein